MQKATIYDWPVSQICTECIHGTFNPAEGTTAQYICNASCAENDGINCPCLETYEARYLKNKGIRCPYCESNSIETTGVIKSDEAYAWQNLQCNVCGRSWKDIYQLVGIEED